MIDLIDIEEFVDDILPEVDECPIPVIERRIRDCLTEACERVPIWKFQHPVIPILPGQREFTLGSPYPDVFVHTILSLRLGNTALRNYTEEDTMNDPYPRAKYGHGFIVPERGKIEIIQDITAPTEMRIHCSLKPGRKTQKVSQVIFNQYHDMVISGTLARLLSMKGQKWTDHQLAALKDSQFEAEIVEAKAQVDGGFSRKPLRIRQRKF